jgi:hypothetical protein
VEHLIRSGLRSTWDSFDELWFLDWDSLPRRLSVTAYRTWTGTSRNPLRGNYGGRHPPLISNGKSASVYRRSASAKQSKSRYFNRLKKCPTIRLRTE